MLSGWIMTFNNLAKNSTLQIDLMREVEDNDLGGGFFNFSAGLYELDDEIIFF